MIYSQNYNQRYGPVSEEKVISDLEDQEWITFHSTADSTMKSV